MWPSILAGGVPTFRRFRNWPTCHSAGGSAGDSHRTKTRGECRGVRGGPTVCQWAHRPITADVAQDLCPVTSSSSYFLWLPASHTPQQVSTLCGKTWNTAVLILNGRFFRVKSIHNWPGDLLVWATSFSVFVSPADFIRGTPPRRRVTTQIAQLLMCCVQVLSEKMAFGAMSTVNKYPSCTALTWGRMGRIE